MPAAMEALSLNHWTTREFLHLTSNIGWGLAPGHARCDLALMEISLASTKMFLFLWGLES